MGFTGSQNSFVVVGDTHGVHKVIIDTIEKTDIRDTTLLHVGDFGVGFMEEYKDRSNMELLNNVLQEHNNQMYVIRGNHDNPAYFDGTWDWSNLHLVPDYTVINVHGHDVLMVGGAISVDRGPRKKDMLAYAAAGKPINTYWYDELFVLDEEKLKDIKGVTYVVTHTCPSFVTPINNTDNNYFSHGGLVEHFVIEGDTKLKDDLNKERADQDRMYEILKENNLISKWFYGHYHRFNAEYYDETDFVMVNVDQFYEVRLG